jgi:uroporphyrinogen-III synthase
VLVMRALHQAGTLREKLIEMGAEPVVVPVLEMRPPASYEPLDAALRGLPDFDWLILTSANAVQAVADRCELLGVFVDGIAVAAVGRMTAAAAEKAGFHVAVVPESLAENSEGVVGALRGMVAGKRVLLARAAVARDVIPEELTAAGARMTVVDAYRTEIPEGAAERLQEALRVGVEVAAFTSSSSVKHLMAVAKEAGVEYPLASSSGLVKAVSIGPVTSGTLREIGWEPAAEAVRADVASLVAAIARAEIRQ